MNLKYWIVEIWDFIKERKAEIKSFNKMPHISYDDGPYVNSFPEISLPPPAFIFNSRSTRKKKVSRSYYRQMHRRNKGRWTYEKPMSQARLYCFNPKGVRLIENIKIDYLRTNPPN